MPPLTAALIKFINNITLAKDAGRAGELLVKLKMPKAPNDGRTNGEWVANTTIVQVLRNIADVSKAHLQSMVNFDIDEAYIMIDGTVSIDDRKRQDKDLVILVNDAQHKDYDHFSLILVCGESQTATVVDTLKQRSDADATALVRRHLPDLQLKQVFNKTTSIRQGGATCGAWALWLACAFVFDINFCRTYVGDSAFSAERLIGTDPVAFWKMVTM